MADKLTATLIITKLVSKENILDFTKTEKIPIVKLTEKHIFIDAKHLAHGTMFPVPTYEAKRHVKNIFTFEKEKTISKFFYTINNEKLELEITSMYIEYSDGSISHYHEPQYYFERIYDTVKIELINKYKHFENITETIDYLKNEKKEGP